MKFCRHLRGSDVRPSTINPYLAFNGNAREAMEFYAGVLGGKLDIQTFGEAGQTMPGADENNVMHAQLEAGDGYQREPQPSGNRGR
jgi:PhnB protein